MGKWSVMLLLSMTIFCWYVLNLNSNSIHYLKMDSHVLATTLDSIAIDLSVRQFNTKGQLTHLLTTPRLKHIPVNDQYLLETPYVWVQEPNQAAWEIQAKEATVLQHGKQITFNKQVIIHQEKFAETESVTLTTDELSYFPKAQMATSLKEVTFRQDNNQIKAIGMRAYLAENRIQLLDQIRGHYAPRKG